MRVLAALTVASLLPTIGGAAAAETFYFRNVRPSFNTPGTPVTPTGPNDPVVPGDTTPPKEDPPKVDPPPEEPVPETGPLTLTLSPSGPIDVTSTTPVRAVFHATGACPGRYFSLRGASVAVLNGFGLSAGASGSDYVISGTINRAGYGGTYGLTVTVRDSCSATSEVYVPLNLNPAPADYDPPFDLHVDDTVAFVGRPFAFYPELQKNGGDYGEVDQTGFTYSIHTLDPAGRPIPSWLSMPDPRTGVLVGTAPAVAGSYGPYYMTVTPPNGGTPQSTDFDVRVSPSFTFNGPGSVDLAANEERNLTFTGSGGCGGINRYFVVSSDTPLPTGMTQVYAEDRWVIQGTPTVGGTWPVRLGYTELGCGPSQFFPVVMTVTGAPVPTLAFRNDQTQVTDIAVGGDPSEQVVGGFLDQSGPPWNTVSCSLTNVDGSPANIPWATEYKLRKDICAFKLNPTLPEQAGSYPVRIKAVTDTRGEALSDPVTMVVTAN